jgi:hypothetical protein
MYKLILRKCRPIYRFGMFVLMVAMISAVMGLVVCLLGKGWIILLISGICAAFGIVIGQTAELCLANEMKFLVDSVTAKEAHDLAARYLRSHGDDVDETDVFLGKFIADQDWREKQKKKQT